MSQAANINQTWSFRANVVRPGIQKTYGVMPMMDSRFRGNDEMMCGHDRVMCGHEISPDEAFL
jgi:hypothetical protein